jgi:elongation factor G
MGDISGGLASKRARINGPIPRAATKSSSVAQVPLSELEGYAAELKSVTAGRGRYSLDFSHYEPVPAAGAAEAHRDYKPKTEED